MISIQENVPIGPLTTFQIGGAAKYFVDASSEDQIREAISWAHDNDVKFVILGGGSNVLVPDHGIDMLVIRISGGSVSFADREVAIDAGCNLLETIQKAAKHGLGGWEKLSGIPGTVGGAVRGNAGAFGSEIKDFIHQIRAINMNTGASRVFGRAECGFAYRDSFFKQNAKWIITRAYVHLGWLAPSESARLTFETIAERERRHLQNVRAAGSYFMNPTAPIEIQHMFEREKSAKSREGRVPAGWLIEKVGMKGHQVGGAIASHQHPNYLVNTGTATAHDVQVLAQEIRTAVKKEFGILLQEEAAVLV